MRLHLGTIRQRTRALSRVRFPAGRRMLRVVPLLAVLWTGSCGLRRAPEVDVIVPAEDQRIRREVETRLAAEPSIEAARIRVSVEGYRVQLHGSVRGIGAWNCAIRTASLVSGVESVVDFLVIERGPRDVTCVATRGVSTRAPPGAESRDGSGRSAYIG